MNSFLNALKTIALNYKTYLPAAGMLGLAVYQFSQEDWASLSVTVAGLVTLLKLHGDSLTQGPAAK